MSHFRNVVLGVFALLSSMAFADNWADRLTVTHLGPANQSSVNGPSAGLTCAAAAQCSFTRSGVVPPGESRAAILVTTAADAVSVRIDLDLWAFEGCRPDPSIPD